MHPAPARTADQGFTLIELLVVLAIIALVIQMVVFNVGALIPSAILDSEAHQFVHNYDFVRSEARLQGKRYKLQLDMDRGRWRMVMPPEDRLTTTQPLPEELVLEWTLLDERARFSTYCVAGGAPVHRGIVDIVVDENGFSSDQSLSFQLRELQDMIWTVQIKGLTGEANLSKSMDKREALLESPTEANF